MGFVKAGEPVEYPYVEKLDGTRPQVQPVILEGRALQKLTAGVSGLSVATLDNHRVIRFTNSVRLRPCQGVPHSHKANKLPGQSPLLAAGATSTK